MNTMVGCPIPGASQPKDTVRLVDANGILRSVGMSGCGYDGSEYQAYKAGAEYVRGLIEDAPTINPETQRPIGTWIVTKTIICGVNRYECPFCGATRFRASAFRLNYCDDCGAKLGVRPC